VGFAYAIEHWRTTDELSKHLFNHSPQVAPWAQGVVIHHTWKPEPRGWSGRPTLEAIRRYYEAKDWNAGPHLFIAVGSPDVTQDGIWQLTPLNRKGIHAGAWNSSHWGIEVVGNYDALPWSDALRFLVYGTVLTLFAWHGITANAKSIVGHRETGSKKSCPGRTIDMNRVRREIQQQQGGG